MCLFWLILLKKWASASENCFLRLKTCFITLEWSQNILGTFLNDKRKNYFSIKKIFFQKIFDLKKFQTESKIPFFWVRMGGGELMVLKSRIFQIFSQKFFWSIFRPSIMSLPKHSGWKWFVMILDHLKVVKKQQKSTFWGGWLLIWSLSHIWRAMEVP